MGLIYAAQAKRFGATVMINLDKDQLLSTAQAARYKGISEDLLRYYVKSGRGPSGVQIGRYRFYAKQDLDAWDRRKVRKPAGRPRKDEDR